VTLRENFAGAGADAGSLSVAGESLVAIHDWTFLLGPGFCVGVNGLLLGYLSYRSGLVPRWMAMFGLVGGPLIFASAIAVLFGAYEQDEAHFLFSIPEIVFELSITIYTIVKGFRPSPILDDTRYAGGGEGSGRAAWVRGNQPTALCPSEPRGLFEEWPGLFAAGPSRKPIRSPTVW
jgi:hypothetical protein